MSASVVLVHGAWHGAWCFERVVDLLRDAGVDAVAIDLPGHGADPGPFTDLHGDAARVNEALDAHTADEVVLLGHSYGGAVITGAGTHPKVRHLVYLCAFALDADEGCVQLAARDVPGVSLEGRPRLADALDVRDDGTSTVRPEAAAGIFYNDCEPVVAAAAVPQLCPQPMLNVAQPPAAVAWRSRPSTYVVCSKDMAIHPDLQRFMAQRCTEVVELDADHSPFLSHPAPLADLLVALAR